MGKNKFFLLLILSLAGVLHAQSQKNALELWRSGDYTQAIEVCLLELETYPDSSHIQIMDSYTVLLWSLISAQRYEEAVKYGMEAYNRARRDWRIIASLGEAHFYLGNNKDSLFFLERYIELRPSGDKADYIYYLMGFLFIRMEEYNRADVALSMAVYLKPLDARWWARLGYAREQAKDYKRSKDAYSQSLLLNPNLVDAQRGIQRVNKSLGL